MTKRRLYTVLALWLVSLAVALAGYWFADMRSKPEPLSWLTWAPNTEPDGDAFIIHYPRGDHPYFGGIKVALDVDVKADQFLCIRLEIEALDDDVYWDWQIQIWFDETTAAAYDFGEGAVCFGGMFHDDVIVVKAHFMGQGHGTVRVRPIITVEDERIYRPNQRRQQ